MPGIDQGGQGALNRADASNPNHMALRLQCIRSNAARTRAFDLHSQQLSPICGSSLTLNYLKFSRYLNDIPVKHTEILTGWGRARVQKRTHPSDDWFAAASVKILGHG